MCLIVKPSVAVLVVGIGVFVVGIGVFVASVLVLVRGDGLVSKFRVKGL